MAGGIANRQVDLALAGKAGLLSYLTGFTTVGRILERVTSGAADKKKALARGPEGVRNRG